MILITILRSFTNRATANHWNHSFSTIHSVAYEVLQSFIRIEESFFINPSEVTPANIANNPKFMPFFEDCIGAFDVCHIPAITTDELFRNRKQFVSQNVLGVCNFDTTFSYVLAGWEGSAHDGDVLRDALTKGSRRYPGKFYLGDAGYALS